MSFRHTYGLKLIALLVLLVVLVVPMMTAAAEPPPPPVTIQFLNVSDWHAQIDPLNPVGSTFIGGAEYISTLWKEDRLEYPNSLTLTAGDDFGASPPLSNFFNEEPSIIAQRLMGIQIGGFGNHNFDRGVNHLQQMIDLAGSPKGKTPGKPFPYVSANLKYRHANLDGVGDYEMFDVGGIKVAVIGITNQEAPTLVFPGSFGTMVLRKPHTVANRVRERAEAAGAQIVIAIIHSGVEGYDGPNPFGRLVDFANKVEGFDVIFGDHTDVQYTGVINGQLVVENRSKGLTYARTLLEVNPKNGKVLSSSVEFVSPNIAGVTPDPKIVQAMQPYRDALGPIFSTQIGTSNLAIPRADSCGNGNGRTCESLIGNLITDAIRETYDVDFAVTNSGGIRADLTCPTTDNPADYCPAFVPPPFPITRGKAQEVLPFGNYVVTLQVNGAELKSMLENGVSSMPGVQGRYPQVSGLCFTYNISNAAGSRVTGAVYADESGCTANPVDLTSATMYDIAENDFMVNGGDTYPNFFSRSVSRDVMVNVVADYITANSPLSPALEGRITCTTNGAPACPVPLIAQ
jgi:2',3'-cyclic-nucleotide 2'-phosphodiesterase (5'-nucleotidase family)